MGDTYVIKQLPIEDIRKAEYQEMALREAMEVQGGKLQENKATSNGHNLL